MPDAVNAVGIRRATPAILDYLHRVHAPHDAGLARAFEVPDGVPPIQINPSDGKLVAMLLQLAGAAKAVEIGTLIGYSAILIARALAPGGHLWTIEYEPHHADLARANLAAAGVADRVTVVVGAGRDALPALVPHAPFDAVFIDADKLSYELYGRWAIENLRPGGLVIADNAYVFGELLDDSPRAAAMRSFHELVAAHCDSVCATTPEGLVIGIKRPRA
jgi:caffeoyl-CoA O-methyltransferase